MAGFSYLFMNPALERWFAPVSGRRHSQTASRSARALADEGRRLNETAGVIAAAIDGKNVSQPELDAIVAAGNLTLLEVLSPDMQTIATSGKPVASNRRTELAVLLEKIRGGNIDDPAFADGSGFDAGVIQMSDGRRVLVVPNFRVDSGVIEMADKSLLEFDRLKQRQTTVRQIALLTLGVLTFLLIFASTWTAFYIARGLTGPIKALAKGADEIARGNLGHRVDVLAEDELALLVAAFNQMSSRLEANSDELGNTERYVARRFSNHSATGVISFDADNRVGTINRAAVNILDLRNSSIGNPLADIVSEDNAAILERVIARAKRIGSASEQTVLRSEGDELPVALTATELAVDAGAVLVIEDLSELISAQRASAWQEVARRMAHEIKNPLTPIQLAAERIAKRFAGTSRVSVVGGQLGSVLPDDQIQNVVEEGTATILREVQSLKAMVDEFTRFARLPNPNPEAGDLNDVIEQVLALYTDRLDGVRIESSLSADLPETMIDSEQLKRALVNLVDNAVEAFDGDQEDKIVTIASRYDMARDLIVSEISDNGRGIAPADLQKLFSRTSRRKAAVRDWAGDRTSDHHRAQQQDKSRCQSAAWCEVHCRVAGDR